MHIFLALVSSTSSPQTLRSSVEQTMATWSMSNTSLLEWLPLVLDLTIFSILIIAAYYGYERGVLSQLFSTPIALGLLLLGTHLSPIAKELVIKFFPNLEGAAFIIGNITLLFFLFFLFVAIEWMVEYIVNRTLLLYMNRSLGIATGMFQALLFLSIAMNIIEGYHSSDIFAHLEAQSYSYKFVRDVYPEIQKSYIGYWVEKLQEWYLSHSSMEKTAS